MAMKMNVEVDCTPEEARRFLGLPDLSPVHDAYVAQMMDMMKGGIAPETLETMMKSWSPMGEAGMRMWQQMFEQMGGAKK
jgi:flagellar motor component MotA